ncbi:MAG: peptide deformylase [Myxococcota bacterium]|nr:peptide deformylase [Myxococcota bacterium]MEC8425179.1 peptide deformylase [Myxococcota bacterium]
MAILPIIEAPNPILGAKARPVREDEFGDDLAQLLDDMAETMYAAPGVGLAAPQVADGRRILVIDPGFEGEDGESQKGIFLVKMVNPVIVERSDARITWEESCLSVPEYAVNVQRSQRIHVRWQDAAGGSHEQDFVGFPAVVVQHEMDHLEGTTLLDHSSRLKRGRYLKRVRKLRAGR